MRTWENGEITVSEVDYNYDLHAFDVYVGDRFLGTVYPATIEDMARCIKALDDGEDPVSDGWEDGCGNVCSLDGWGNK
jgi:hypothetical protein